MSHSSLQIYLNSADATYKNATRNRLGMLLNEPIKVPDGYNVHIMLVDAQIPVAWDDFHKFLLVKSNLKSRNQYVTQRYFAKIPIDVAYNHWLIYTNHVSYKHPVSDRDITYIELTLYDDDENEVSLLDTNTNTLYEWSCTLQIDFVKI